MDAENPFHKLSRLIQTLRGEGGCPWDREQRFDDVVPSLVEEAYELEWANAKRSRDEVIEELGDVFFVLFFAIEILGETDPDVTPERIAARAYDKIKRRHPHVFGDEKADTTSQSLYHWNRMKEEERRAKRPDTSALAGVPDNLPPIRRSETLQRHAARVGFDWPDTTGIIAKLHEEIDELDHCLADGARDKITEEIGDLFFSVVNLSRFLDIDGESSIERANAKFQERFRKMEAMILADGKSLESLTLDEMDVYWDKIKSTE
jgi:MazG family protein